jgi:hypothetical protein
MFMLLHLLSESVQAKWYYYAILSLVDVEANFLGEYITLVAVLTRYLGLVFSALPSTFNLNICTNSFFFSFAFNLF